MARDLVCGKEIDESEARHRESAARVQQLSIGGSERMRLMYLLAITQTVRR